METRTTDKNESKVYVAPVLNELGNFGELTMGSQGSFNDGAGGGGGMAEQGGPNDGRP